MNPLKRRYQSLRAESERGAISTLVLILFTSGLVVVLLSLVVDSGALQVQRRESQNTADSLAQAFAVLCSSAATISDCAPNGTAATKVNAILSAVNPAIPATLGTVCGSASLHGLRNAMPTCGNLQGITRDCVQPDLVNNPWWKFWVRNYVKVSTASQTSALFPLTGALLGGAAQLDVWACGQYAFGSANSIKILNSVVPIAFNPCEISVSGNSIVAMTGDGSASACSFKDFSNLSVTYTKHGMYRWEAGAGTGPCANGSSLDVNETICISSKTPTQTGIYYPNTLQLMVASAVSTGTRTLLPVVNGLTGSSVTDGTKGTFSTAKVIGFLDAKIKGYKSGVNSAGTAPAIGWNVACSTSTVMCINATVNQRLSTQGTIAQDVTTPNFGVVSLSPMN